jgi:hypothetical protein
MCFARLEIIVGAVEPEWAPGSDAGSLRPRPVVPVRITSCTPATSNKQNAWSEKFHAGAEKLPCSRRRIGAMASTIESAANRRGTIMTITEYLGATILVALILRAVLGLLMQES